MPNYIDPTKSRPVGLRGVRNSDLYGGATQEEIEAALEGLRRSHERNKRAASGTTRLGTYNDPGFYEPQYLDKDDPRNELGKSSFDSNMMFNPTPQDIRDSRAENQPWYSKLVNGTLKGVITAGTTFVNGTLGLIAGVGQGLVNLTDEDDTTGFLQGIWDNSITNMTQKISDWQEKALPNYYTTAEANTSFDLFSANFWGDKFIKNLGFTIGAFYSGGLYSKALQGVTALPGLARSFTASAISAINEGSIEAINGTRDWYDQKMREIDKLDLSDTSELKSQFKQRADALLQEYQQNAGNFVQNLDGTYADPAYQKYEQGIKQLEQEYKVAEQQLKNRKQALIDRVKEDRAKMGNVILGENLPILTASYMWQFGKLFANGFKTANRTSKIITASERSLAEDAAKNTARYAVKSNKAVPYLKGFSNALAEGTEEISQKGAVEVPSNYYSKDIMNYYKSLKDPDAEQETLSWITSFGEGISKTLGEASSWEEFLIGSMTGFLGVPVFGRSNTQQAYLGRDKAVGLVGGFAGGFQEYNQQQKKDKELVDALNARIQSPEFLNYYRGMIRHNKEQSEMDKAADAGDVFEFNNHEHSQMVSDITMWDNAGKLDDLRELINSAADGALENITELLEKTTQVASANPKYQENVRKLQSLIDDRDEDIRRLTEEKRDAVRSGDKKRADAIDITLQGKLRELGVLQDNLDNLLSKKDDYIGAFIDNNGNPFTEEAIAEAIEKNRRDALDTLEHYVKIKNEIDSQTNYRFTSDQLSILTWLKSHKDNWDSRAETMSKEIKEKGLPIILKGMQAELKEEQEKLDKITDREKEADKVKEIEDGIKELNDMMESISGWQALQDKEFARTLASSPIIGAMLSSMLGTAAVTGLIDAMERKDLDQKLKDIIKCAMASEQYNQKLMEYLLTPQSLKDDMQKADEETAKRVTDRENNRILENIKSTAKTVKDLRAALSLLPNSDEILDKLVNDSDENVSKLAKAYKEIKNLETIGHKFLAVPPKNAADVTATEGALLTFNNIIENANTVEEAVKAIEDDIKKTEEENEGEVANYGYVEQMIADKLKELLEEYKEAKNTQKEQQKTPNKKAAPKKDNGPQKGGLTEEEVSREATGKAISPNDVFQAYKKLHNGQEIAESLKQDIIDAVNNGTPLRDAIPEEWQSIYDAIENGTIDRIIAINKGEQVDDDDELEELDLDELNEILEEKSVEEALQYLNNLDLSKASESDKKNIDKLKRLLQEKLDNPDVQGSDEGDSNAESNNTDTSSEPKFRSFVAAKYLFDELKSPSRRAERNRHNDEVSKRIDALDALGAFTFVDTGELGKLFKNNPNLRIHYVMPAKGILGNSILLAIELTDDVRRKVNNKHVVSTEINGKRYQIIGELGYKGSDTTAETQYHELVEAIKQERGRIEGDYFVSQKFHNKIKHMYSGRMVKTGEVVEGSDAVSSEAILVRPLRKVLNGIKAILGIYYSASDFRTPGLPHGAHRVPLNPNNKNPREGSVWLMTREADGNYYAKALQVARLKPSEYSWQKHRDTPIIKEILSCLETICDETASISDRVLAKYTLQEQLLYFPEGTQILFNKGGVTIIQNGTAYGVKHGTKEEMAENALNQLSTLEESLRFQIKTAEIADEEYIEKLLESDILTIDLLIAHNVNASFDLYLNDMDTGEPLVSNADPSDRTGHTGPTGVNEELKGVTVAIGNKNYTLHEDNRVTLRGKPISDSNIIEEVKLIVNAKNGNIQPINGSNVYEGKYLDGTTFAVVINGAVNTIYRGEEAEKRIQAAKNKNETEERLEAAKKNKKRRNAAEDGPTDDEPILKEMSDDDLEQDAESGSIIPAESRIVTVKTQVTAFLDKLFEADEKRHKFKNGVTVEQILDSLEKYAALESTKNKNVDEIIRDIEHIFKKNGGEFYINNIAAFGMSRTEFANLVIRLAQRSVEQGTTGTNEETEGSKPKGTVIIGRGGAQESAGKSKTPMNSFKGKMGGRSFKSAFREVSELFAGDSLSEKLEDLYARIEGNPEWKERAENIGREEDAQKAVDEFKSLLNDIKCT